MSDKSGNILQVSDESVVENTFHEINNESVVNPSVRELVVDSEVKNSDMNDKGTEEPHDHTSEIQLNKEIDELSESIARVVTTNDIAVQAGDSPLEIDEKSQKTEKKVELDDEPETGIKQVYRLKWIEWHNKKTPIVTQNENGPCPLIALANILLLRGKITLRATLEYICASDLMDYIGNAIMESIPKNLAGPSMLNYEQNMHDAIAILPQLHTGLDVNIKFTGVQHFEYTPECIIFDLLNIPLYHGWLVDPQCHDIVKAVGNLGYNQLVEKIILNKCSLDSDLVTEALIAEQFLERTASQLTYHGLCELNSAMKQEELAVLFRNNHFSTILKKKHELFQLVTDQGFLHEPRVVWETLCNIEGDGQFVDCRFATVPPKAPECFIPDTAMTEEQQINQDEELARRMQEEQQTQQVPCRAPSPSSSASGRLPPSPGGERGKKGAMCNVI